ARAGPRSTCTLVFDVLTTLVAASVSTLLADRFWRPEQLTHTRNHRRTGFLARNRTRQRQCPRRRRPAEIAHTSRRSARFKHFGQVRRVRAPLLRERRNTLLRLVRRELRQRTHPQLRRLVVHPIRR